MECILKRTAKKEIRMVNLLHIWTIEKWRRFYDNKDIRSGLRLKFDKNVNPEVRRACKEFCKWLRKEYYFPIRVPIYVKSSKRIKAKDCQMVFATFFGPFDYMQEPYIKISTGDYEKMLMKYGNDNALASILASIAHELTHYYQWINGLQLTEIGEERQATMYSHYIIDEYSETREHP